MAQAGLCSRRRAELFIKAGVVEVNGSVIRKMGFLVDLSKDKIKVEGKPLAAKGQSVSYVLNKPKGVITSLSDPQRRPCVGDWIEKLGVRLYPVGRLDYVAEGLLLLTNDGDLAHKVMHPSFGIIKRYRVGLESHPSEAQLKRIMAGAVMDGRKVKPHRVRMAAGKTGSKSIEIEVTDGRHHEVRILCERAGLKIQRLIRTAIGSLLLGSLKPGGMRQVQQADINKIFSTQNQGRSWTSSKKSSATARIPANARSPRRFGSAASRSKKSGPGHAGFAKPSSTKEYGRKGVASPQGKARNESPRGKSNPRKAKTQTRRHPQKSRSRKKG